MKASSLWCWLSVSAMCIASVPLVCAEDNSVVAVQKALKEKHFYFGDVDGNWDDATQGALRRFQFRNGLPGTGDMDDATVRALAGNPPLPKAVCASDIAQAGRHPKVSRPIEKDEMRIEMEATATGKPDRKPPARLNTTEQRAVPSVVYMEQFPSWSTLHRGAAEKAVEVRRAIPVTSEIGGETQPVPRGIAGAPTNGIGGSEPSQEIVTTITAHFTGQDGHVYTYYRKIRTRLPDGSNSAVSPNGLGERAVSFPPEISDRQRNEGGLAHR